MSFALTLTVPPQVQERRPETWVSIALSDMDKKRYSRLGNLALVGAFISIVADITLTQHLIKKSAEARPAPFHYTRPWLPKEKEVPAGGLLYFDVERINDAEELFVGGVEGWRNVKTGAMYDFQITARELPKGRSEVEAVRHVPEHLPPGQYQLQGWVLPQTVYRSLPVRYTSDPFKVTKRPQADELGK